MDFLKAHTDREAVATCRFSKLNRLDGISDKAEGKAPCRTLPGFENARERSPWIGRRVEICFDKDCANIPPSLASADSVINTRHAVTFDEGGPETTVKYRSVRSEESLHLPDSATNMVTALVVYVHVL